MTTRTSISGASFPRLELAKSDISKCAAGHDDTYIYNNSGGTLMYKQDSAGTNTVAHTFTGQFFIRAFPTWTAGTILMDVQTNTGTNQTHDIYRSSDYGTTLDNSDSPVLALGDGNNGSDGQTKEITTLARNVAKVTLSGVNCILLGEYNVNSSRTNGGANDRVRIMKSIDDGLTWTQLGVFNTVSNKHDLRHSHGIFQDPYDKKVYFCFGDTNAECGILQWDGVTDWDNINNKSLSEIGGNFTGFKAVHSAQRYRTCDLLFTQNKIIWGSDTNTTNEAGIWQMNKDMTGIERVNSDIETYSQLLMYAAQSDNNFYILGGLYTGTSNRYYYVFSRIKSGGDWKLIGKIQVRNGSTDDLPFEFFWLFDKLWVGSNNLQYGSTSITRAVLSFNEGGNKYTTNIPAYFGVVK